MQDDIKASLSDFGRYEQAAQPNFAVWGIGNVNGVCQANELFYPRNARAKIGGDIRRRLRGEQKPTFGSYHILT